ncbi:MmcQ/YjbR family DNA-binding protein [Nocardioides sp. zg-536]|uniref:MmcQ/YjbR family DNA-binding protein n=1 Tax=Nocardioides faecalis TaxID=2803858 RepID=A0A938Y5D7_9ACTN|nr:MmcQ/YjbR family DNA-binding protein [Nocardioides faecalis]MBM9459532.1 MmcQ/YjbR family DNA-binding protein [Nocardioides faecalis]MBS4753688.1 MmcQ/YjbR family DNA-binding protein [Nocardioides faecalis]QVI58065.1 MmcQ/YjbR family DNA-binding protein [Nocardioides faecalis]
MATRPEVPGAYLARLRAVLSRLPECTEEAAWVGVRWRVAGRTVAHVFGGEDQQFRLTFRAEPDEVMAFQHLGDPYFRLGWSADAVGMIIDDETDWTEVGELLTDSYCLRAPKRLADQVPRPRP